MLTYLGGKRKSIELCSSSDSQELVQETSPVRKKVLKKKKVLSSQSSSDEILHDGDSDIR